MCFINCQYESYPNGHNEGCVCRLPWHETCPMDREEEEQQEDDGEEDAEN